VTNGQFTIREIVALAKRRKWILLLAPTVSLVLAVIVALVIPRKYESETSILVQRDDILNPLVSYTMAVVEASGDRLRTLDEVIYSRSTIEMLIDSLKLAPGELGVVGRELLIKEVRGSIRTGRRGADVFSVAYMDTEPLRTQRGASLLSNYVIETILRVENQRNEMAVVFFERKLEEYRLKYEESQREVIQSIRRTLPDGRSELQNLNAQLRGIEQQIQSTDQQIKTRQGSLEILRRFPSALGSTWGNGAIYDLLLRDLPYGQDLRSAFAEFESLSSKYTLSYPDVTRARQDVEEALARMETAVEKQLATMQGNRWDEEGRRTEILDRITASTEAENLPDPSEGNLNLFESIYDEMKIKLEQARMTRDLGLRGKDHSIVLDPPIVPISPSKPSRVMIVGGGLAMGILLGLVGAIVTEALDTTIRTPKDIEFYQKRVIAYLPDTRRWKER
jgi:capsular polysaccharide biosynthesis protein